MVELIVMIFFVIPWFYRAAKNQGKGTLRWVLTGLLSYYGPFVLFDRFVIPPLLEEYVTLDNIIFLNIIKASLSVVIGISCCLFAGRLLTSDKPHNVSELSTAYNQEHYRGHKKHRHGMWILSGFYLLSNFSSNLLRVLFNFLEDGHASWNVFDTLDLKMLTISFCFGLLLFKIGTNYRTAIYWGLIVALTNTGFFHFSSGLFGHPNTVRVFANIGWWFFVSAVVMASYIVAANIKRPALWSFMGLRVVAGITLNILWLVVRPTLDLSNPIDTVRYTTVEWFSSFYLLLMGKWVTQDLVASIVLYYGFKIAGLLTINVAPARDLPA
jgi:hypothetical protein